MTLLGNLTPGTAFRFSKAQLSPEGKNRGIGCSADDHPKCLWKVLSHYTDGHGNKFTKVSCIVRQANCGRGANPHWSDRQVEPSFSNILDTRLET